mgnify:CR=1 FL=1
MWIIRFHLLQSKHYNKINRICKKYGFVTRKHTPLVFSKALVLHITQKTSWRTLGREFGVDHILLYRFHDFASKSDMLREILHVFLESRSALNIGNTKQINSDTLNNSSEIYDLTKSRFESIIMRNT